MQGEFERIKQLLEKNCVEFDLFEHEAVYTSEQAAKVRGVELKTGVKAMIFKAKKKEEFFLTLLPGDKRVDAKKLKEIVGAEVELAKPIEVLEHCGCEIGSVHPFGNLMRVERIFADKSVFENEFVEFNVGLHTVSLKMKSGDLLRIVKPEVVDYAKS